MCRDYYELDFMDRSIDTSPIAPELAKFFDEVRLATHLRDFAVGCKLTVLFGIITRLATTLPDLPSLSIRCWTAACQSSTSAPLLTAWERYNMNCASASAAQHRLHVLNERARPVSPQRVAAQCAAAW